MVTPSFERDIRQRDLIPREGLLACHALVIGVGAIGRQVALQLAAVGIPQLTLFDDDTVEVENLAPQGYWPEDLKQPKVLATAALCRRVYPEMNVVPYAERFRRSAAKTLPVAPKLVVFCCVDSIETRKLIWESVRFKAAFLTDGRMNAEVIRVVAVSSPATDNSYARTLFSAEEAHAGSCTARATIYTGSLAAGLMLAQFTKWLRGFPVDADLTLNLLSAELSTGNSGYEVSRQVHANQATG